MSCLAELPPKRKCPRLTASLLALVALSGCGDEDGSSPVNSTRAVGSYRLALEPVIVAVNEVELDVQESAVGSSGQATAANLAAAFGRLRPRLAGAREAYDRIEPPSSMADLHTGIGELIGLRLEAFDALLQGHANDDPELYAVAEERLRQANELIPGLNERLMEIDLDLAAAGAPQVSTGLHRRRQSSRRFNAAPGLNVGAAVARLGPRQTALQVRPPSTTSWAPVTKQASSEAR